MAINWQRTVMRAMGAREQVVTVKQVERVLPWYLRITFSAPEFMKDLELFPTIWIRLWVRDLDDPSALRQRGFTLVDPDPVAGTFALEFVIHEPTGPAASWAIGATPGDTVEIAITPSKLMPDPGISRFILVGDATAIPAMNSFLEYLPQETQTDVVLADPHHDAESLLRLRADSRLTRVAPTGLAQALRDLAPDLEDTYIWVGGERWAITQIRGVVRREWKLPKDRQHTQYYWIEGKPFG